MNPDAISEPSLRDQRRELCGQGLRPPGRDFRGSQQEREDKEKKHRATRHARHPSSVVLCLLALCAACSSRAPKANDDALVLILPRDAEQLDPRFVSDPYGLRVSRLLFASLVTVNPRTLEVVPDLAESIETPTPTRYLVRLREGLRFSDGTPLTARDVAATFEGLVDPQLRSRYANNYRRIERITVLDPRTLHFELDAPHATFLTDLEIPIVREQDARRRVATPEEPFPVGAGPYRLVGRGSGSLELQANPYWHRGAPKHPKLRLVVIRDDNTRALRMLAGQGDLALAAIPPLLLPMFEEDRRFELRSAPGIATMYLGFQTESPKLRDPRVRRAIAHAIDREQIVKSKYGGLARVTDSWIPEGHWARADKLPSPEFSPARARELLDEAGFVELPGGVPRMRLSLRTTSDRFRQSVARAIAAMLRNVGIEVDVRPSEAATLISDLNKGQFELSLLQMPEVLEPHVLSWFFDSSRIPGPQGEGANRWRYRNESLDRLFEQGRSTISQSERAGTYRRVQQTLAKDLPVLPLWQPDTVAVLRRGIDFDVPRDGRFATLAF